MYIADIHIHSKYSRATSKDCDIAHLDLWAANKGIRLVGTGDFTHPAWREELHAALIRGEDGFYTLREDARLPYQAAGVEDAPRFVVTGEISSIYKKDGKTRKVHNLIVLPSLEDAELLSQRLEAIGNIRSDGRPILGLDSRDLLEITLEACPEAIFIPAHIWTPHFSMFGAFSGFDTVEACFNDMAPYIHAVETGLSSDPPMNWRISSLDRFTLVSNSDAHSPAKLGREANLLEGECSFPAFRRAVTTGEGFAGTVEFFPEEGKYHYDGHRNCRQCLKPSEAIRLEGKCPVCGKKLTIGVDHRVEDLADRPEGYRPETAKNFENVVPLLEVIASSTGNSVASRKTAEQYSHMLASLGPEFRILRELPLAEIEHTAGAQIAEGIRRMRAGEVVKTPGYDGEYGVISLFAPGELETFAGQLSLFPSTETVPAKSPAVAPLTMHRTNTPELTLDTEKASGETLNPEQCASVRAKEPAIAVIAGPGTGKTHTLIARIVHLIQDCGVKPAEITAVTFTNQAAAELRERLESALGSRKAVKGMTVGTFHAICLQLLEDEKVLLGEGEIREIVQDILQSYTGKHAPEQVVRMISAVKNGVIQEDEMTDPALYDRYQAKLAQLQARDLDDLLLDVLQVPIEKKRMFTYLLVDEFQDINPVQMELVKRWGRKHLFVIGDPDQSIYGFRGADAACFAALQEEFPALHIIRLKENYRSTPEILDCALSVISHNPGEIRILSHNQPARVPVRLVHAATPFAESVWIAKEINRMTGGMDMLEAQTQTGKRQIVRSFSDIAILCRTRRQLELLENCLQHDGIPCVISGREAYLHDEKVRGAVCFFRWLLMPWDIHALRTCLKSVWKFPEDLILRLESLFAGVRCVNLEALQTEAGTSGHLVLWYQDVTAYRERVRREKPRKILEDFAAQHGESDAFTRLLHAAVFYNDMPSFLKALTIGEEADVQRASGHAYASGAVRLMTLHGAKGLEFPVVFLAGLNAGTLPYERAHEAGNVEEERRLLYVGITRAREELVLSVSEKPSQFVLELPDTVTKERAEAKNYVPQVEQIRLF